MSFANWTWLNRRLLRLRRRLWLKRSFISMYKDSSGDNSRKSSTVPTFQPFSSRRSFFLLRIVVILESLLAHLDNLLRSALGLLTEYFANHNCVMVHSVNDSPCCILVHNAKFAAPGANAGHRSRVRQRQRFSSLEASQEISGLNARSLRERRCLDLTV